MIQEGQVILYRFPQTNRSDGKLRPALVIRKLPGPYNDWLICMASTQVDRAIDGFDEVIRSADSDFLDSGLKSESVFRLSRLAVVEGTTLVGAIGQINAERLSQIKTTVSEWIKST